MRNQRHVVFKLRQLEFGSVTNTLPHNIKTDPGSQQKVPCREDGRQELVQEADGSFVQYVPAPLLQQVNIVDTPGTNVILDRQQRLTEEFVPRADLVLFCLSAGGSAVSAAADGDPVC